jgi:hypothetical protein
MKIFKIIIWKFISCTFLLFSVHTTYPEEGLKNKDFSIIPLASYDYIHLAEQTIHTPALGIAIIAGDYDKDYMDINKSFFGVSMYQPVFISYAVDHKIYHQIDVLLDGRIERHQLLGIFRSASDEPVSGGFQTFQAGAGWGYELIRNSSVSFILGAAVAVGDFGIDLPNGDTLPVLPLPLIRLKFKTEWLAGSFDFLTGPNLSFIIAPDMRIRFTADVRMDYYRSVEDVIGEGIIWYRFFPVEHSGISKSSLGDFLGIGLGIKNESFGFDLAGAVDKTFESQYTSIFGLLDISILQISAGYIFDSRNLYNENVKENTGKGYYISVQGMYRF